MGVTQMAQPQMGASLGNSPLGAMSLGGLAHRPLEMRELRYFHSVARAGNFGRAARELDVAQPTITKQVQKLEESLGTQLFIRHGRGVTLTPAGSCLLDRIDIIMNLLRAPLHEARGPEAPAGTVSLALPPECSPLLVPPLIARCRALWPRLGLTVREADSASLEEWVLGGRIDVALLQDPAALDELEVDPILTERLGLVVSARSSLGDSSAPVRARDLAGLAMILPQPRHWIRRRVENAWFQRGLNLDRVQEVEGVAVMKEMARNELGCAILPFSAVRDEVGRGLLAFRPIEQMPLFAVHAIARRRGGDAPPVIPAFARALREVMSALVDQGSWAGASLAARSRP